MYGIRILPAAGSVGFLAMYTNKLLGLGVFLIIAGLIILKFIRLRLNERKTSQEES